MLFGRKIALFAATALMVSAVGACSSNVTPVAVSLNGETSFVDSNLVTRISQNVTQSKQDTSHFYIDAGNGLKTGASFSVKLDFSNGGGFKTKAGNNSADGTASKVVSDMSKLRVALIQSAASPTDLSGALSIGSGPSTTLDLTKSGSAPTITFTNVPENTTLLSDNYWVAAAALDSGNVNITNSSGITLGSEKYYVTNGGGGVNVLNVNPGDLFYDTGNSASMIVPAGSVKVGKKITSGSTNYYVSNTAALTMTLQLKEATGATIGSDVTVTNGGDRVSTVIGAS